MPPSRRKALINLPVHYKKKQMLCKGKPFTLSRHTASYCERKSYFSTGCSFMIKNFSYTVDNKTMFCYTVTKRNKTLFCRKDAL